MVDRSQVMYLDQLLVDPSLTDHIEYKNAVTLATRERDIEIAKNLCRNINALDGMSSKVSKNVVYIALAYAKDLLSDPPVLIRAIVCIKEIIIIPWGFVGENYKPLKFLTTNAFLLYLISPTTNYKNIVLEKIKQRNDIVSHTAIYRMEKSLGHKIYTISLVDTFLCWNGINIHVYEIPTYYNCCVLEIGKQKTIVDSIIDDNLINTIIKLQSI